MGAHQGIHHCTVDDLVGGVPVGNGQWCDAHGATVAKGASWDDGPAGGAVVGTVDQQRHHLHKVWQQPACEFQTAALACLHAPASLGAQSQGMAYVRV